MRRREQHAGGKFEITVVPTFFPLRPHDSLPFFFNLPLEISMENILFLSPRFLLFCPRGKGCACARVSFVIGIRFLNFGCVIAVPRGGWK